MNSTILLIEDNPEMADNVVSILKLAHYQVLWACSGKTGVEMAQKNKPDLILCDIMMPDLDGYGVLHILNSEPGTATIPFVFLTAKADRSDLRHGMNLGADDYITKPFDMVDLLSVVEMRLKKNELLKATLSNNALDVNNFFSNARSLNEFSKLSENRPVRSFKKKDILFMEGQTPNDLYFIEKGQIKTYKSNYDGKELITGIFNEGDFFGYVSLLEENPYNESAEVLEDAKVSIIPKSDFLALLYSNQSVARKFIKMLSNNVADMENRLLDIAYQSVRQRVAGVLIKLNEKLVLQKLDTIITISRKELANMVGTATESLNRTLADFKDEGLLTIAHDGLRITDVAKLKRNVVQ